jgi:YggT family protein
VISWIPQEHLYQYRQITVFIFRSTEWVLKPLKRRIPLVAGNLDLSPMLVLLVLYFLDLFLIKSLFMLAARLGA